MLTAARPVDPTLDEVHATLNSEQKGRCNRLQARRGCTLYTTVLCRAMQVRRTSSIGLPHQSLEKISISE